MRSFASSLVCCIKSVIVEPMLYKTMLRQRTRHVPSSRLFRFQGMSIVVDRFVLWFNLKSKVKQNNFCIMHPHSAAQRHDPPTMIANSQEILMHHNAMCDDERFDRLLRTKVRIVLLETLLMVAHLSWWIAGEATVATTWTWHAHGIDRWWRSGSVGGARRTTVVLRSSPAESDSRVSDRVTLHLVDGHLGSVSLNELDKAAALSRRNLDVCYLAKSLEEGSQLILSHIA